MLVQNALPRGVYEAVNLLIAFTSSGCVGIFCVPDDQQRVALSGTLWRVLDVIDPQDRRDAA